MAKDRTRWFRIEARELLDGLSRGILDLERAPADRALVARLLRQAHTLKGAARVVQEQAIGDLAHDAEEALASHREDGAPPVPHDRIDALLRVVDQIAAAVARLEPAAATPRAAPPGDGAAAPPEPAEALQSVRVDLRDMDALVEAVLEAGVQVTQLRRQVARLEGAQELARAMTEQLASPRSEGGGARLRPLADELRRSLDEARRALVERADHAANELAEVRGAADRLRLLPARAIFGAVERAARDAARTLGKAISFEALGADVRVDAHVLAEIRAALLHAVRNAVAHGVEPAERRVRAGKPPAGRIEVRAERRGARVAFSCRDDGGGIDVAAVRAAALGKGVVTAAEAEGLDAAGVARLLLRGGLSTSAGADAISGRGVGLDVVRDVAGRLQAEVVLESEPGGGTTFEMVVPVTLTAMTVLRLEAGGAAVAVPLDAVREAAFLEPGAIVATPAGAAVEHDGALVPFVPLARLVGGAEADGPRRFWSAVVVEAGGRRAALGADRLVGTGDVVVRPLPAYLEADASVAGAALDAEGNPRLVLDPAGVVDAARSRAGPLDVRPPQERAPILVIDDSLTTRMLEQSILEGAGYEVDLAVSAEEALDMARARRYGLFVVDVEMPGMDGFEFVRVTRADARLSATPAVLVTSRAAPEDRRRGLEAGASAYVVKGEFDQGKLLAILKELVG
jgi:two-component system chemotaxis sensor kinase CheA